MKQLDTVDKGPSPRISFRLSTSEWKQLKKLADRRKQKASDIIREGLRFILAQSK